MVKQKNLFNTGFFGFSAKYFQVQSSIWIWYLVRAAFAEIAAGKLLGVKMIRLVSLKLTTKTCYISMIFPSIEMGSRVTL